MAFFAFGQVLPALHFALVGHRVCAEHGSLEHGHHALSASAPGEARGGSAAVDPNAADDDHEHCGIAATSPLRGTSPARDAHSLLAFADARVPVVVESQLNRPQLPLLAYAPKLAPPA